MMPLCSGSTGLGREGLTICKARNGGLVIRAAFELLAGSGARGRAGSGRHSELGDLSAGFQQAKLQDEQSIPLPRQVFV